MKKSLFLILFFFLIGNLYSVQTKDNELSMQEMEQRSEPSLISRLLDYLLGKRRLEAYSQRSKEYRPHVTEW